MIVFMRVWLFCFGLMCFLRGRNYCVGSLFSMLRKGRFGMIFCMVWKVLIFI